MTVSLRSRPTVEVERRPASVKWTIGVLTFLGFTALGGGIEMLLFSEGNEYLPSDMLDSIPFDTFIVPGLVLGGIFGLGSLFVAWGVWKRPEVDWLNWVEDVTYRHWAWAASVLLGWGFTLWMVIEISMLGAPWTQAETGGGMSTWILYGIYGTVAALLLTVPHSRKVRDYLRRPHRS